MGLLVLLGRPRRERLGRLLPRCQGCLLRWLRGWLLRGVLGTRSVVARSLVVRTTHVSSSRGLRQHDAGQRAVQEQGVADSRVLRVMVWVIVAYGLGRRVVLAGSLPAGGPGKRSALI